MSDDGREAVKQDYLESLQELTFNSKPIITNLTVIAQENVEFADSIAQAITEHISKVSELNQTEIDSDTNKCAPAYKLPALYLLDSISKNVGAPYTTLFSQQLSKVYTQAYSMVPDSVRQKMYELFQTWRHVPPAGAPLFDPNAMSRVENFLNEARAAVVDVDQMRRQSELQRHVQQIMTNGQLPQSALLTEVDKLLDLTRQRKSIAPNDVDAQKQYLILTQLRDVLSKSALPQEILPSIQQQLVTFNQKEAARLSTYGSGRPSSSAPPPAPNNFPLGLDLSKLNLPQRGVVPPPMHNSRPPNQHNQNSALHALLSGIQKPPQYPTGPALQQQQQSQQMLPQFGSLSSDSLLKSLKSAELLNGGVPPVGLIAGPSAIGGVVLQVELSNASLQNPRIDLVETLYGAQSMKCGACGKRFPDTVTGRSERSAHMDWHFRVNKKMRDDNRSLNRCWYLSQEDWIEYKDEEETLGISTDNGNGSKGDAEGDDKKNKNAIPEEELRKQYVLVPSDKALAALPCPVCQEKFDRVWNDDVEDWVWMNAVNVQGKRILHATCYSEAQRTGNDFVRKLVEGSKRTSSGTSSRKNTPTPGVAPAPAPAPLKDVLGGLNLADILASAKRKRDDSPAEDRTVKKERV